MKDSITIPKRNDMLIKDNLVGALIFLVLLLPIRVNSQYNVFKIYEPYTIEKFQPLELVQMDFRESSTLLHFTLTNPSSLETNYFIDRGFKLVDRETNQSYRLLKSYNLPLDNANEFGRLSEFGNKLNFTLEFEKVPDNLAHFDLVEKEDSKDAFNIHGVVIYKDHVADEYVDVSRFISETPLETTDYFYHNGEIVRYISDESGLTVAAHIEVVKNYGKYFRINLSIQNLTGESVTVFPEDIKAVAAYNLGENNFKDAEVLSHDKYMKKVKNRQAWNSVALGLSSGITASSAGYSNSTTYGSDYSYNSYGSTYSHGTAYTTTYDGAAAYAAQQNAINTIGSFENQQYEIKNTLSEGYLKRNTISNETEYVGYIKIPYSKKIRTLNVIIPINGKEYKFVF
jgi:hypothetical protein